MRIKVIQLGVLDLFVSNVINGQNIPSEAEVLGTWTAHVSQYKSERAKMMFDGSTITLIANHSFTASAMNGFKGEWKLKNDEIVLESRNLPEPIVLENLSSDSCTWNFNAMNTTITFYKNKSEKEALLKTLDIASNQLIGKWMNARVEDVSKTEEENINLFGSNNKDILILSENGDFSLSKSANTSITGRIFKGTWLVENGVIHFKSDSNKTERLGITQFDGAKLVLVNMEKRAVPMCGETRIRFSHTKVSNTN